MLRSPRDKFTSSVHFDGFKKIVQTEAFEEATLAALLELEREQPIECLPQQSVDAHQQMVGARRYLEILCSLQQPQQETTKAPARGLNYAAGV